MKVTAERDMLAAATAQAARALPKTGITPVLMGMRLDAAEGLTASAFDYEVSSQERIEADVADEGTVVVSGRLLTEIVRSLPDRPVHLETDDAGRLEVKAGAALFKLHQLPVDEYPQLPKFPPLAGTVGSGLFCDAIAQAVVAATKDDTLPALTCVLVEVRGSQLRLVATDRFRLTLRELAWAPVDESISTDVLIPGRTLTEIAKRAGEAAETAIHLGDKGPHSPGIAGFEAGSWQATTRLVDAEFPRVQQLLPDEFTAVAEVPVKAFTEAVKRVALVAERNTPVRTTFSKGKARLEAGTGDEATASEDVDVTFDHDEFPIAFQPQYLIDGLTSAGTGDTVHISLTTPARPAIITPKAEDSGYRYVLMPIRSAG